MPESVYSAGDANYSSQHKTRTTSLYRPPIRSVASLETYTCTNKSVLTARLNVIDAHDIREAFKSTLEILARNADIAGEIRGISVRALAGSRRVTEVTVRRHIAALVESGLLAIVVPPTNRLAAVYQLGRSVTHPHEYGVDITVRRVERRRRALRAARTVRRQAVVDRDTLVDVELARAIAAGELVEDITGGLDEPAREEPTSPDPAPSADACSKASEPPHPARSGFSARRPRIRDMVRRSWLDLLSRAERPDPDPLPCGRPSPPVYGHPDRLHAALASARAEIRLAAERAAWTEDLERNRTPDERRRVAAQQAALRGLVRSAEIAARVEAIHRAEAAGLRVAQAQHGRR